MNIQDIEKFIDKQNLNVFQKGGNPRFIDQKCTPDVVSFIADCIVNLAKTSFEAKDILQSEYFAKNAVLIFGKPSPKNIKTSNEYDKFRSQPLDLFSYAGLLHKQKKGNKNFYTINEKEILEFIGLSHREAFQFLYCYLRKLLTDSNNFIKYVDSFLSKQDKDSFEILKKKFGQLLISTYNLGSKRSSNKGTVEVNRIFPKVINIFSAHEMLLGATKGRLSKNIIVFNDMMYNRVNFRDINKLKNVARKENVKANYSSKKGYIKFLTNKAMQWVKKLHPYSEINDKHYGPTAAIHHIFPRSEFPEISYYKENLIALTAGQHQDIAHPQGKTNEIDAEYQKVCLKAKKKTISKDIINYSRNDFIFVLNTGFEKKIEEISSMATFSDIDIAIEEYYKNL